MRTVKEIFTALTVLLIVASCGGKEIKYSGMSVMEFALDTLVCSQAPRLVVVYENEDFSEARLEVADSSEDHMKWRFVYSDSLRGRFKYMSIYFEHTQDTVHEVCFKVPENQYESGMNSEYSFGEGERRSSLRFLKQTTIEPCQFTGWRTMILTDLLIEQTDDIELSASIEGTILYGSFFDVEDYESGLEKYGALASKYPDSQYLMTQLASSLIEYRSKTDLRGVYEGFSDENKCGYWGSKIANYLAADHFENIELSAWDSRELEPVIKDPSKTNLVVFSASWCMPCHAMIPLLKELHHELTDKLDIVYVSMDEEASAGRWDAMVREEQIPWRSVIALDKKAYVENKYSFTAIPHQLLVYPDGRMETIDVRKEEGLVKLHSATAR